VSGALLYSFCSSIGRARIRLFSTDGQVFLEPEVIF
jgi:hypothetical protein